MRIRISLRLVAIQVIVVSLLISNGALLHADGAGKTHLYFITNAGCAPCRQVEPGIEALKREGYPVTTVIYDNNRQWATQLGVDRTPTVVMISNNEMVGRHAGLIDAVTLKKWFAAQGINSGSAYAASQAKATPPGSKYVLPKSDGREDKAQFSERGQTDGGYSTPTMLKGTIQPRNATEQLALQATVRLKVEDPEGTSYATGTVIHSRPGECLVVTCGHVFRDSEGTGTITAQYGFGSGTPKSVAGELISYDSNARDIGLVAIKAFDDILPVPISNRQASIERGRDVFSIGCDHGETPTIRRSRIKNRAVYDKAIKYDIYGRPVDGRSGGGLFTEEGELIGICNAAAVEVDEGIYTALDTIYWQLAKVNLAHLFGNSQLAASSVPSRPLPVEDIPSQTYANGPPRNNQFLEGRGQSPAGGRLASIPTRRPVRTTLEWPGGRRSSSDTEVLILIRSKTRPSGTEAITIADPSPELINFLERMNSGQATQLEMARHRTQNSSQRR